MREPRAAIVSTLRNAGAVVDSFIAYHSAIGFAHFFLYFDDPKDPDLHRLAALPNVTAIPHDATLREAWKRLPQYPNQSPFLETEVMSRQVLNAEHAIGLARALGLDWLLHIDLDELFYLPSGTLGAHFARLEQQGMEAVNYLNYEAVPEKLDVGDYFREVDLFKIQPTLLRGVTAAAFAFAHTVPQMLPSIFHFYGTGKSAMNLSAPEMRPFGVHFFERAGAPYRAIQDLSGFILHYPCCGFEHFWTKYATLGRFGDRWWGRDDIKSLVPVHLESRDVVCSGDRAAAREFYRRRFAIEDAATVNTLLRHNLLTRFTQPRRILQKAE
jgi:hypothetical protein